ncbi:DUF1049 domain-containing protein [Streptomyces sp. TRM 70361]|uniref:DUF1049 domain-containing protein n=1 Tax=Streptomyces sp. TRM 70361 TaxID=3116553 RepID=UPI002E7AE76D|nr:DUF1049 domain-containing protein [Streptomyces sp. TRM 70361]MEE1941909.1 DUF1049 domain-containing protein [Streptomyces sp. TRM 70361]
MTHSRRGGGRDADGGGGRGFVTPGRLAVLLLTALALVFVFQNTGQTRIRLLVPVVTMPLWVALLIPGVVGVLAGMYLVRRR